MKQKLAKNKKTAKANSGLISMAWPPFAKRLASELEKLEENQYQIISVKNSNRFVQFASQGKSGMRIETTSNSYLPKQEQLKDMNANEHLIRFVHRNGNFYGICDISASPYVSGQVTEAFKYFCSIADGMDSLLQEEFGGHTTYTETMPSSVKH